jgi:outer membrane immunogenic protein
MTRLSAASIALLAAMVSAQAADPTPFPAAIPVPPTSWTGIYLGGNFGGGWLREQMGDRFTGASWDTEQVGVLAGLQGGFNYQLRNLALGAEWDVDWARLDVTGDPIRTSGGLLQGFGHTHGITTVAARLGVALNDWLIYGKAGGGWAATTFGIANLTTTRATSVSDTISGWLMAGGVEYAFAPHWTAKLEYAHLDLGGSNAASSLFPGDSLPASRNIRMLRLGINYKFGWGGAGAVNE